MFEDKMRDPEWKAVYCQAFEDTIKYQVICIYRSPITGDLEYRTAYFCEYAEAEIWKNQLKKRYEDLGISHSIDILYHELKD